MRRLRLLVPAILALAAPSVARAQAPAAEALFEQGRQALAAGDLDTACARFRASDQVEPAAGTRANLADCEERRGRVASAWEAYQSALAKLPPGDTRIPIVQDRIKKLEARLPKLVLSLAPGAPRETGVKEGDAMLGAAATYGVPLPLDPGAHHLAVTAPGRAPRNLDVTLAEGKTATLTVEPGPPEAASSSPSSAASSSSTASPTAAPAGGSAGPWIIGGVGVVGLVAGAITGAIVLHAKSVADAHCTLGPPPTCKDQTGMDAASLVRTLGPATTVTLAFGATGVAAGAVWLGLQRSEKSTVAFGVGPTYGGAAWRVEGSW